MVIKVERTSALGVDLILQCQAETASLQKGHRLGGGGCRRSPAWEVGGAFL